ncbi:MAG: GyrI-like domain-containing protein [Planctomycetota bacterium]
MADVEVKTVEPQTVMSHSFQGSYTQVMDRLDELMAWQLRVGHPYSDRPFAIYYDDPQDVPEDELRAEVCLPIAEELEPEEDFERRRVEGGQFVSVMHHGSYSALDESYDVLFDWIDENECEMIDEAGTREIFHRIIGEVDSVEELETEVMVPVEMPEDWDEE